MHLQLNISSIRLFHQCIRQQSLNYCKADRLKLLIMNFLCPNNFILDIYMKLLQSINASLACSNTLFASAKLTIIDITSRTLIFISQKTYRNLNSIILLILIRILKACCANWWVLTGLAVWDIAGRTAFLSDDK